MSQYCTVSNLIIKKIFFHKEHNLFLHSLAVAADAVVCLPLCCYRHNLWVNLSCLKLFIMPLLIIYLCFFSWEDITIINNLSIHFYVFFISFILLLLSSHSSSFKAPSCESVLRKRCCHKEKRAKWRGKWEKNKLIK